MESLIPRGNSTLEAEFAQQLQRTVDWLNSLPLERLDRPARTAQSPIERFGSVGT